MSYYPIFLELEGKIALVIGGGRVSERKIQTLLSYGASIDIVSKQLTDKLKELVEVGKIRHLGEEFREAYLDNAFLVVAATDDKLLNHKVSERARERGLLVNAVDQPGDCNFIVPSVVKRGDLLIAISTSGKSPALSKKIRRGLEGQFGREYETFITLMGRVRKQILSKGFSQKENHRIFHEIVDSEILDALARNDLESVEYILGQILPEGSDIKEVLNHNVHS